MVVTNDMSEKKHVLILCTGNSARSQMAEGWLRHLAGDEYDVESAGTIASFVRPQAIAVMAEVGIDMTGHRSKCLGEFLGTPFDHVITVCDNAAQNCPMFPGSAERVHWSFDDPAEAQGSEEEIMQVFRRVRDEIRAKLGGFIERPARNRAGPNYSKPSLRAIYRLPREQR